MCFPIKQQSRYLCLYLFLDNDHHQPTTDNTMSYSPGSEAITSPNEEPPTFPNNYQDAAWQFAAHRHGYHSNNHVYRSRDMRYTPYATASPGNTFIPNGVSPSFHHRPTPVTFGQSFAAHPVYGSYPVPSGYMSSRDVYPSEPSMENHVDVAY